MTPDEIREVGEALIASMQHVLNNTLGESHAKAKEFLLNHILKYRPWMMVTESDAMTLEETVFGTSDIQNFMLSLTYTFGVYWGASADKYKALAGVLGIAAGIQPESILAKEIKDRTEVPDRATTRLMGNRWLMVLMLVSCFVEASYFEQSAPRKK